jgi:hypothetical protein
VAIEEVVAGQVFKGRRTSLRAGSASQVFAGSRTASEDKDAGHRPEGRANVGHAFKTRLPHKSSISVRPTPDKSLTPEDHWIACDPHDPRPSPPNRSVSRVDATSRTGLRTPDERIERRLRDAQHAAWC